MGGWQREERTKVVERTKRATLVAIAAAALIIAGAGYPLGEAAAQNEVSAGEGGTSTVTGGGEGVFTSAPVETVSTEITASNSLVVADASGGDGNLSDTNR